MTLLQAGVGRDLHCDSALFTLTVLAGLVRDSVASQGPLSADKRDWALLCSSYESMLAVSKAVSWGVRGQD